MVHCPMCGQPAKAVTTEKRPDPDDKGKEPLQRALRVTVYHHDFKNCREWEPWTPR